jgi:DNA polymerase III epsilon subunit-like protein
LQIYTANGLKGNITGADFDAGYDVITKKYQGISFGAIIADNETLEEIESVYCEIQFDGSKYQWTDGAEKIHGLSRDYLQTNGVTREDACAILLELILKYIGAGNKVCIGGHNADFDIAFTGQLTGDFGVDLPIHHVKLETSGASFIAIGKYRSDDVFAFFGGAERKAHNALDDARLALASARGIKQLVQAALGE